MKTSVYINKGNEEAIKELQKNNPKLTTSGIINEALREYTNKYSFDTAELRSKSNYRLVVIRLHKEIIRLLVALKKNFSAKAVKEMLMYLIIEQFRKQTCRRTFPDRFYGGLDYINRKLATLSKKADLFKLPKID